ncbi:MAG: hypothetical protein H6Q89_2463, partial [Myxococcaceae bacterium]|nr:hypothetical protein [Myxococcaceae bacterium]
AYLPDGGSDGGMFAITLTTDPVDDLSDARLPGWTQDGLALTGLTDAGTSSTVTTYPGFSMGSPASIANRRAGVQWVQVRAWRDWLMLVKASANTNSEAVGFSPDGGIVSVSGKIASGMWDEAMQADLDGNGQPDFVMQKASGVYGMYESLATVPTTPPSLFNVAAGDAGFIPVGLGFTVGSYGFGVSMFTLSSTGALRQFESFQLNGITYRGPEVPRPDLADAGYVQVVLADVNGDGGNDLVLIERTTGNLRIAITP